MPSADGMRMSDGFKQVTFEGHVKTLIVSDQDGAVTRPDVEAAVR